MKTTKHCEIRQKQRYISNSVIALALSCGIEIKNSDKVILRKSEVEDLYSNLFQLIKQLDAA